MPRSALTDIQEKALQTAQRFVDYDGYEGSEARAVSALTRRCQGWTRDECRPWFLKAVQVYRAGIAFLELHRDAAYAHHIQNDKTVDLSPIAGDFLAAHDDFPDDRLLGVLSWVFYWHHLR